MNVDSTTISASKAAEQTSSSSSSATTAKDGTKAFKDELASAKIQEESTKASEAKETEATAVKSDDTQNAKTSSDNILQQISKDKLETDKLLKNEENENSEIINSLNKLNSKISSITMLRSGINKDASAIKSKSGEKINGDFSQSIKMDNQDIAFFLSLTDNQQMTAQAALTTGQNNLLGGNFTEVKAEATQKTVQVSQTMLDALNDSIKTNKPFRIDFGGDVAVIMKVDKNGAISATFLPGNAAVEAYLKNNIASLKQNFDNQNLSYNELSYSEKYRENQKEKQKNRENKDE